MAHVLSSAPTQFSVVEFFRKTMQNLIEASAKRRAYHQTRNQLLALNDAMLADLGLTRSEINRVALEASIGSSHH
jgi:uncharacterized protein YjiS (DUF1127 family)